MSDCSLSIALSRLRPYRRTDKIGFMKTIKAVTVDLDGTILKRSGDISPDNQNVLNQLNEDGVIIGISTGREVGYVHDHLDFWKLGDAVSFIVGSNGCEYLNLKNRKYIRKYSLNEKDLISFEKEFDEADVVYGVRYKKKLYLNRINIWALLYCFFNRLKPVKNDFGALQDKEFYRILIFGPQKEIGRIFYAWKHSQLKAVPMGKYVLELVHPGVSKFTGVRQAMLDFDFKPCEVICFGDDYNDIELLRQTIGVAMKNSPQPVLESARQVTKYAGPQDGVAYHLNSLQISEDYQFGPEKTVEPEDLPDNRLPESDHEEKADIVVELKELPKKSRSQR